jgi:hypothetical protein
MRLDPTTSWNAPSSNPFVHHTAFKAAGIYGPLHVGPLLNDPKLLKATAKFVEASGRFA